MTFTVLGKDYDVVQEVDLTFLRIAAGHVADAAAQGVEWFKAKILPKLKDVWGDIKPVPPRQHHAPTGGLPPRVAVPAPVAAARRAASPASSCLSPS